MQKDSMFRRLNIIRRAKNGKILWNLIILLNQKVNDPDIRVRRLQLGGRTLGMQELQTSTI